MGNEPASYIADSEGGQHSNSSSLAVGSSYSAPCQCRVVDNPTSRCPWDGQSGSTTFRTAVATTSVFVEFILLQTFPSFVPNPPVSRAQTSPLSCRCLAMRPSIGFVHHAVAITARSPALSTAMRSAELGGEFSGRGRRKFCSCVYGSHALIQCLL